MNSKITSSDIARLAHCSQSTVSRALSQEHAWRISPKKRLEIQALCHKYGYAPNSLPAPKLFRITHKVGFLLGEMERDLTMTSFGFMLREMSDLLQAYGYTLTLIRVDYATPVLARNVRRILKSDTADIYIAGAILLKGQTLDLLRQVSSRLISFMPFCATKTVHIDYRWISQIDFEYEKAHDALVRLLPKEYLQSAIYLGAGDLSDQQKYSMLTKALRNHYHSVYHLPKLYHQQHYTLWDQCYRQSRKIWQSHLPELMDRKLFFCGNQYAAYALSDLLQTKGLQPDRDFLVVTYGGLSQLTTSYAQDHDPFSVISYSIKQTSQAICDLAMRLVDDPTPQQIDIPVSFTPSPALGGTLPHQII